MRIFEFKVVGTEYLSLIEDDRYGKTDEERERINASLDFTGKAKGNQWVPPPVFATHPRKPVPDIWAVGVGSGAFAVTPKVLDKLGMFLEMAGELLPISYKDLVLNVCNITECVDCIDAEKSEWQQITASHKILKKAAFNVSYLPESTLFKIPEWPRRMLCWERNGESESEFKACVEANKFKGGFKGNFFQLIWESPE